jgi:hypothetical protein
MESSGSVFSAVGISFVMMSQTPAAAADMQTNRMKVEYVPPTNSAHQALYGLIKERRVLEKLQEIFSPFRLPVDLTLRTVGCDGVSNAWYGRKEHQVSVCYEYLDEIWQSAPKETTADGITPIDAVVGQFYYVVAHEFGHAMFDVLQVPSFGSAEDAADQFSTYMMLHMGKDDARRLVAGAAFSYRNAVQSSASIVPLQAFSDLHGIPAQRFFNMLCIAYGAEVILHGDRATLFDKLHEVREARGATFVHPFDDPTVLAGAGTTGLEILEDLPEADIVVVPVGGGGLMGGVASAVKAVRPSCRVIAVELEEGPGLGPALAAGAPVPVARPKATLADGMTPPFVGALPLAIARQRVDAIVTVTEAEIVHAMEALVMRAKLVVEGSGAAATAALLAGKVACPSGARVVCIVSGGNMDVGRLMGLFGGRESGEA